MQSEFKRLIVFIIISVFIIIGFQGIQSHGETIDTPQKVEKVEASVEDKKSPSGIILGPLNMLLELTREQTSNVGLAIIVMTLLLRLIFSPLQYLSTKSMKKMEELKPYLDKIKERFKDDPMKMQQETMKLYKEKSVNPVMGILPMLVQMPLFISIFTLLRESPTVVGEGFWGWLTDLSIPDPLFILPLVAGAIQLLVMLYGTNSSAGPKMGNKLKMVMAVVFTGLMIKMPAALLIYSITSSLSSLVEKGIMSKLISL